MRIKDFSPEEIVYVVRKQENHPTPVYTIEQYRVVSVGRKYVNAASSQIQTRYYLAKDEDNYLTEQKDWGYPRLLFAKEEHAKEYVEREMLIRWVKIATSYQRLNTYTLHQLRAVKVALDG